MTKTIFVNTFLVGALVLLLCGLLFFGMQYTRVKDDTIETLGEESLYVVEGLMQSGPEYLEALEGVNRVTWIDADGNVLYDSELELPSENQAELDEVRAAFETGEGHCSRNSESGGLPTIYFARLCPDGTVLRLSRSLSALHYALVSVSPVLWVLVLVLLISGMLSFRVAKQIVKPINEIDIDHLETGGYPELAPFVDKIREQKITIEEETLRREQMRREFSANVSHELKTPLTSIMGFAELMANGMADEEKMREFSRDIYKESCRTISLIDDIIRLSKLDEGGVEPEWEDIDLYSLSSEVIDSLHSAAEKQNVTVSLTGDRAKVKAVYRILNETVYNLVDNAIKYNRAGGSVEVRITDDEDAVRLIVADTGIGIPLEHQKRVFERFYRVDKSHSKEIGGTGLGLSIVKHSAIFLGAEVSLTSEIGVGTTVKVEFGKKRETEETNAEK